MSRHFQQQFFIFYLIYFFLVEGSGVQTHNLELIQEELLPLHRSQRYQHSARNHDRFAFTQFGLVHFSTSQVHDNLTNRL